MVQAKQQGEYPADWVQIAHEIKKAADWHCVRCGVEHDASNTNGNMLTVHHWDGNKSNCEWWNLLPLCASCHLQIQHKVHPDQVWLLPHSAWFKPYVAGWYAHNFGFDVDRKFCERFQDSLILLGQEHIMPEQFLLTVRTALYSDVDLLVWHLEARLNEGEDE